MSSYSSSTNSSDQSSSSSSSDNESFSSQDQKISADYSKEYVNQGDPGYQVLLADYLKTKRSDSKKEKPNKLGICKEHGKIFDYKQYQRHLKIVHSTKAVQKTLYSGHQKQQFCSICKLWDDTYKTKLGYKLHLLLHTKSDLNDHNIDIMKVWKGEQVVNKIIERNEDYALNSQYEYQEIQQNYENYLIKHFRRRMAENKILMMKILCQLMIQLKKTTQTFRKKRNFAEIVHLEDLYFIIGKAKQAKIFKKIQR